MSFLPQEERELNINDSQKYYRSVVGENWSYYMSEREHQRCSEKHSTPKKGFSHTDQQMSFLPQEGRELNINDSQK